MYDNVQSSCNLLYIARYLILRAYELYTRSNIRTSFYVLENYFKGYLLNLEYKINQKNNFPGNFHKI